MTRGRFITLEGGEGAGKSTQLRALADALRARGFEVVETREPGGSLGAEAIRALLLDGSLDRWNAQSEALLFAAARADHVARTIEPALERRAWVISDRFIDSNRAYQGAASGMNDADILALHRIGSGGLMPDRTLVLTLPPEEAEQRTRLRDAGKPDRFGARDAAFHARVAAAFVTFVAQEPERIHAIDASGSAPQVTERIISALGDLLP
ncbi:MAG: dTMP kinase [Sphingobium sp.]